MSGGSPPDACGPAPLAGGDGPRGAEAGLPLALNVLACLAELDTAGRGVSLTRVAKRLGVRVSVLMRVCTQLSDARIGGQDGPGWVRLWLLEERWVAALTEVGRAAFGEAVAAPR